MTKNKVLQLTKAEEQVMQILWELGKGLVKDIRDRFEEPRPARNTISTVVRVLERKKYVDHKAYGNIHVYYPVVTKKEYSRNLLFRLLNGYFDNSFASLAAFFARETDLSFREMEKLLEDLRKELKKNKKKK